MYTYVGKEEHDKMELVAKMELLCRQVKMSRLLKEAQRGWYKGDIYWARVSINKGRAYMAKKEEK